MRFQRHADPRKGGVLAEDYVPWPDCGDSDPMCICTTGGAGDPPCCTAKPSATYCNQIVAYDWHNAARNDLVAVFDEVFTIETEPELRMVTAVGNPDVGKGTAVITLDQGLKYPHWRSSRTLSTPYQPTFSNHKSAGFGVISGCDLSSNQLNAQSSCFYQADLRGVEDAYDGAFVEIYAPREGMGAVPFVTGALFDVTQTAVNRAIDFGRTWSQHWKVVPGQPRQCGWNNYFHVIGASDSVNDYGLTWDAANTTYVFVDRVRANDGSGSPFINAVQWVTNHETAHQFSVNPCNSDQHDGEDAWCSASGCGAQPGGYTIRCVMNVGSDYKQNREDGIDRFCEKNLFTEQQSCGGHQGTIRRSQDPR